MTDALLSVDGLNAHYGRAHILRGVSFAIGRGEVVALLGRNGAGKSTTMKAVMGLVPPTSGSVRFGGQEIAGTSRSRSPAPASAMCRRSGASSPN